MKAEVLIDWLTFSVKSAQTPQEVIDKYLGMDCALFQAAPGLMGYQRGLVFSDIRVFYEPLENDCFKNMGICVSMSGNGCRTFEAMSALTMDMPTDAQDGQSAPFLALFRRLAADGSANISRIDVACDDRTGSLDMDEISVRVQRNDINSRMACRSVVASYNGAQRSGTTVYIGNL